MLQPDSNRFPVFLLYRYHFLFIWRYPIKLSQKDKCNYRQTKSVLDSENPYMKMIWRNKSFNFLFHLFVSEVKKIIMDITEGCNERQQKIWDYLSHRCTGISRAFPTVVAGVSDVLEAVRFISMIGEILREKLKTLSTFLQTDLGTSYELTEEKFLKAFQDFKLKDMSAKLHPDSTKLQHEMLDSIFNVYHSRAATLAKSADLWDHILKEIMSKGMSSDTPSMHMGSSNQPVRVDITVTNESVSNRCAARNEPVSDELRQFIETSNLYKREYGNVIRGALSGQYSSTDLSNFSNSMYRDVICEKGDSLMSSMKEDLDLDSEQGKQDFEKLNEFREILRQSAEEGMDPYQMTMKIDEIRKYMAKRFGGI